MCLLIYKPAGTQVPVEYLNRAATAHPHGFGASWVGPEGLKLWRSVDKPLDWVRLARRLSEYPTILHARWATHGPKIKANCHPAWLNGERSAVVGHNGMLSKVPDCTQGRSDTRVFIDHVLRWMRGTWWRDAVLIQQLGELVGAGNKLAVLTKEGEFALINEGSGQWDEGVWYSNDSYLPASKHLARTRGHKYLWDYDSWDHAADSYLDRQAERTRTTSRSAKARFLGYRDTSTGSVVCTGCYAENGSWLEKYYRSDWTGLWDADTEQLPAELQAGLACEYCSKHLLGSCSEAC